MGIIEKLGISTGPWESVEFKYRGHNKVHTHEIHFGLDGECVAEYVAEKQNAQLIAAAPEMLEALINNCKDLEESCSGRVIIEDKYSKIFEKATGKTWEEIRELIK